MPKWISVEKAVIKYHIEKRSDPALGGNGTIPYVIHRQCSER